MGWWLGVAGVLAVALGGVAILSAPRWAAHTDLTPARWACGLLVLLLAGVLLTAVLAPGTRRWVREAPAPLAGSSQPAEVWRVAEPGADLTARPGGTVIVARLAPGTVLAGVMRRGHYVQVTAPDGQSGWVDRRSLH